VTADLLFWLLARATGVAAFVALLVAVTSGITLRTSVLDRIGPIRAWRELHSFATILWLPLGALHVLALVLDQTARVDPIDLVVPFRMEYGTLAIGLGTIALDLVLAVAITAPLRRRVPMGLWTAVHRLAYPAMALSFLHALLAGSDFSVPEVSAVLWSLAAAAAVLAGARVVWGRLPA